MFDWVQELWNGFVSWFQELWDSIVEFFTDLPLVILDSFLSAIAAVLEVIPVPDFLQTGLSGFLAGIDPSVLYFLDRSGFDSAIAILGTGVMFRLTRKLVTLGRW